MTGTPEEESSARSTLGVARDVILSLTQIVADSAELVSATMREEVHRFRVMMLRGVLAAVAAVAGAALLAAAAAMSLREWLDWPLTLLLLGAVCLGIAYLLQRPSR